MFQIRIIGLGPGPEKYLTIEAVEFIEDEYPNFLRTEQHESVTYLRRSNIDYKSFDKLYDESEEFSSVYETIAKTLIHEAKTSPVNYFVPGDPLVAEDAVQILLRTYENVKIVHGVSFIEPVLRVVNCDPVNGLKIVDGDEFSSLDFDPQVDTIITQVYNQRILSEVKLAIGEIYGDECQLYLISNAGMDEQEEVHRLSAYELDRGYEVGIQTSIFIPGRQDRNRYTIRDLLDHVDQLAPLPSREDVICAFEASVKRFIEDKSNPDPYVQEMNLARLLQLLVVLSYQNVKDGRFSLTDLTSSAMEYMISTNVEEYK